MYQKIYSDISIKNIQCGRFIEGKIINTDIYRKMFLKLDYPCPFLSYPSNQLTSNVGPTIISI